MYAQNPQNPNESTIYGPHDLIIHRSSKIHFTAMRFLSSCPGIEITLQPIRVISCACELLGHEPIVPQMPLLYNANYWSPH